MTGYPHAKIAAHLMRMFPDTGKSFGWLVTDWGYEQVEIKGPSVNGLRGGEPRLPVRLHGRLRSVHPFLVRRTPEDAAMLHVAAAKLVEQGDFETMAEAVIHLVEAALRGSGD